VHEQGIAACAYLRQEKERNRVNGTVPELRRFFSLDISVQRQRTCCSVSLGLPLTANTTTDARSQTEPLILMLGHTRLA
jgi:hypothetical protein